MCPIEIIIYMYTSDVYGREIFLNESTDMNSFGCYNLKGLLCPNEFRGENRR